MKKKFYNTSEMNVQTKPNSLRFDDLEGQKFNRLAVLGYAGQRRWFCKCDCQNVIRVFSYDLKKGHTNSCGCWHLEKASEGNLIHGQTDSKEHYIYRGAKQRCNNPKNKHFHLYGARGIEFRFDSFEEFIEDIGERPSLKHTVDRINNDGHYEKGNIQWATQKEQCRNKRFNILLTFKNETHCMSEWAEILGVSKQFVQSRIRRGWCGECALSLPKKQHCQHKTR